MKLLPGMSEQLRQVLQALALLETPAGAVICERPEVAFVPQHGCSFRRRRPVRCGILRRVVRLSAARLARQCERFSEQHFHPQWLSDRDCVGQQGQGPGAVPTRATAQQHRGIVVLGVRQPRAGSHASVHLDGSLEVLRRCVPTPRRRGEQPEIARDCALTEQAVGVDDAVPFVRAHEVVQELGAPCIVHHGGDLGETGQRIEPEPVPRHVGKVTRGQAVEDATRLFDAPGRRIDQRQPFEGLLGVGELLGQGRDGADAPLEVTRLAVARDHQPSQVRLDVPIVRLQCSRAVLQHQISHAMELPVEERAHRSERTDVAQMRRIAKFGGESAVDGDLRVGSVDVTELEEVTRPVQTREDGEHGVVEDRCQRHLLGRDRPASFDGVRRPQRLVGAVERQEERPRIADAAGHFHGFFAESGPALACIGALVERAREPSEHEGAQVAVLGRQGATGFLEQAMAQLVESLDVDPSAAAMSAARARSSGAASCRARSAVCSNASTASRIDPAL